jgi:hypothetical protein
MLFITEYSLRITQKIAVQLLKYTRNLPFPWLLVYFRVAAEDDIRPPKKTALKD